MMNHEFDAEPTNMPGDDILDLENILRSGEDSEIIECFENYLAAKEALLVKSKEVMAGEGESAAENLAHLESLTTEMAQNFAHVILSLDPDDRCEAATRILQAAIDEVDELTGQPTEYSHEPGELNDEMYQAFDEILDDDDSTNFTTLEQSMGCSVSNRLNNFFQDAAGNRNDAKRHRQQQIKHQAIEQTKDVAKIAIGVTIAGFVLRRLGRL